MADMPCSFVGEPEYCFQCQSFFRCREMQKLVDFSEEEYNGIEETMLTFFGEKGYNPKKTEALLKKQREFREKVKRLYSSKPD